MVLLDSLWTSRIPRYLGFLPAVILFRLRDSHPLWLAFPCHSSRSLQCVMQPRNPSHRNDWFRLLRFRSPLLAESLFVFFSSGYWDVSLPRVSSLSGDSSSLSGCPIRKPMINRLLTAHHGLSQSTASFIAVHRLGILYVLFVAWQSLNSLIAVRSPLSWYLFYCQSTFHNFMTCVTYMCLFTYFFVTSGVFIQHQTCSPLLDCIATALYDRLATTIVYLY